MNSVVSLNSIRFIILVLVQVLIFNNINFMGYINPYIYILFIVLYPTKNNRALLIFLSFLLGLSIDLWYWWYSCSGFRFYCLCKTRNFTICIWCAIWKLCHKISERRVWRKTNLYYAFNFIAPCCFVFFRNI